jgi:hypothetical protein
MFYWDSSGLIYMKSLPVESKINIHWLCDTIIIVLVTVII